MPQMNYVVGDVVAQQGDVVAQWIERQTASIVVPGSNLGIS